MKTYIHVNQHKIRANKKHGTNEPVITVKQGKKNTYCHSVEVMVRYGGNEKPILSCGAVVRYGGNEQTNTILWCKSSYRNRK